MGLTIDVLATDGSPIGVIPADIYGKGVGGAELALMSWAETMAKRGHTVRVFNDPAMPGQFDNVWYMPKRLFEPNKYRDVFVLFRSPNPLLRTVKAGLKIHWSTDQYTIGDFGRDIFPWVDKVVCISPFHVDYHKERYQIDNGKIGYIDLGVRLADYPPENDIEKVPGRCIFCSVPDRGLPLLHRAWAHIKREVPEASLVITSDYRLWGNATAGNHQHRIQWAGLPDVTFLGKVPRVQLVEEQLKAVCMPYPVTYDELFCISAAECQVSGAVPVTAKTGALRSTNQWGFQIEGHPAAADWQMSFVPQVVEAMRLDDYDRRWRQEQAAKRFDWNGICKQWEQLIEAGEFASIPAYTTEVTA